MALSQVNEGSTAYLTVSFYDKDGNLETPTQITWQAHDLLSSGPGTELQAETQVQVPAGTVEIEIPPEVNRIVRGAKIERRLITVKATFGIGQASNAAYEYEVANLSTVGA